MQISNFYSGTCWLKLRKLWIMRIEQEELQLKREVLLSINETGKQIQIPNIPIWMSRIY